MAYDEKYRARAVEYKDSGHTFVELKEVFRISSYSYYKWTANKKETGYYAPQTGPRTRKRKIDPQKLLQAVEEKPDQYLRELADKFQCSTTAIYKRLKSLNLTYKKRHLLIRKNPKPTVPNIRKK